MGLYFSFGRKIGVFIEVLWVSSRFNVVMSRLKYERRRLIGMFFGFFLICFFGGIFSF